MTAADRLAASAAIRKLRDKSRHDWLTKKSAPEPQEEEQQEPASNPLISLAHAAMRLYARKNAVQGLDWQDGRSPLALTCACLATVRKNMGV
jgi:hypothetical protein